MRQKDFDEVMTVLGTELRTCDSMEAEGLEVAASAVIGYARHRYPEVDTEQALACLGRARTPLALR